MTLYENRFKEDCIGSIAESVADIISALLAPIILIGSLLMLIGLFVITLIMRLDKTELFDNRAGMFMIMLLGSIPVAVLGLGVIISTPVKWLKEVVNERLTCCGYV
jgi:hypothetical protein